MSFIEPQVKKRILDVNAEIAELKGSLSDKETKIYLAKFLIHNLSFTFKLLTGAGGDGVELYPFQELLLRMLFEKDNVLCVMGRGTGKTWIAAVFIILYAIVYPGSKIGIIGPSFRNTRKLFQEIQKIKNKKGAALLHQIITDEKCAPDINQLKIGTSEVFALPLGSSGDKIRGYRFNVVILDEAGFVPEKIITSVIIPFLSTNIDPIKRQNLVKQEEDLVSRGLMKEEEKTVFKNNKFIALSSATYQFEYLYRLYKVYKENVLNPEKNQLASYGIFQMSYEASPEGLLDRANIEGAKKSFSTIEFDKEYRAIFPLDSDSFFGMKKMEDATLAEGSDPSFELFGNSKDDYLLSIDPNSLNKSTSADHFGMSVFKLDKENRKVYLVHQFAACDLDIIDYIQYLAYLLENFNINAISIDASGASFIQICNDSQIFKDKNLKLDFFEADFHVEDREYVKELNKARRSYNKMARKICYSQQFTNDWKRAANEHLQNCIEFKKIMFASTPDDNKWGMYSDTNIANFDKLKFLSGEKESVDNVARKIEFLEHQKYLMKDVKAQCCLIQLKVTEQGTHTFELPQNIRRQTGKLKTRRDLWTTLFMGNQMAKYYFDMFSTDEKFNYDNKWCPYIL
ncbi:terminase large subunit domain-containing protein [Flavobacterium sp.]|uniref:terminase large subunit domain-containing protein n=1 Tax=Flavobacterium sp. TaxID=239 RepID=UPI0038FC71CA